MDVLEGYSRYFSDSDVCFRYGNQLLFRPCQKGWQLSWESVGTSRNCNTPSSQYSQLESREWRGRRERAGWSEEAVGYRLISLHYIKPGGLASLPASGTLHTPPSSNQQKSKTNFSKCKKPERPFMVPLSTRHQVHELSWQTTLTKTEYFFHQIVSSKSSFLHSPSKKAADPNLIIEQEFLEENSGEE